MRAALERLRARWAALAQLARRRPFPADTPEGRAQERYRRILLTSASSLGVRLAGTAIGLVTVPIVLGYLGKERYGLWSTITTLVAWVTLFDLGIANGLVNLIAREHGRDDRPGAARHLSTALALLLSVAVAFGVALALLSGRVPWQSVLAVRGAVDAETVRRAVVAALGMFAIGLPLSVVPQIYAGYQKTYLANLFTLGGMLAGFGALLAAVHAGASLPVLVVTFGIGALLSSAGALAWALGVAMPWLRFRPAAVSLQGVGTLMSRSLPIFLFQVGALLVNETQVIILAHRCDLAVVADYAIAMRLYLLFMSLMQLSTQSFVPSFREARERGDHDWTRENFRRFVGVRMLLAAGGGAVLILAGNPLLRLWLRRTDLQFSPWLWSAMAVVMVASTWVGAYGELLTIMDRLWIQVALVFANAAVTVALTWWLAPSLGVLGVIIASGAVTVLCFTWAMPPLARLLLRAEPRSGLVE